MLNENGINVFVLPENKIQAFNLLTWACLARLRNKVGHVLVRLAIKKYNEVFSICELL